MMAARIRKSVLLLLAAAVLAWAFYGYLRPAFILDLANRLILCL